MIPNPLLNDMSSPTAHGQGMDGSRKRKEPSFTSPMASSPMNNNSNNGVNAFAAGNGHAHGINGGGQFVPLAPSLPQVGSGVSPTASSLAANTAGRTQTKVAAVATPGTIVDRPSSASALLSALSAATGAAVPSLHAPHLVKPNPGVIPMPSVLALSPIGMQAKASPLAAHRPTATPTTPTNGASVVQPKVVAQSAGAKIAQKGVPIPQQLTVKPKVVPTMTAIRPIAQQSQQPRAPRPIAVETKVPATQPPKPSVTKPAVTKPIVTKPPAATATTPTAAAASSSSSNGAVAPVMVAITQGGQTVYEEDDSDPNRLWCFCRMPHTPGTFMIACDTCLEWYHGECVAVEEDDADAIDIYECPLCAGDEYAYELAVHRARQKKRAHKGEQQRLRKERQQRRSGSRRIAVVSSDSDSDSDSDDSDDDIPLTNLGRAGSSGTGTPRAAGATGAAGSISDGVKASKRQQRMKDRFAKEREKILIKQERARIKKASDPTYYDEVRAKVRESLAAILDEDLANSIEAQLYKVIGDGGKNYKIRFRDLISNLNDKNNPQLIGRVKSGALTPAVLCSMTAKELASRELDAQRKQQQKDFMKDKVVATVVVPVPVMGKGNRDIEPQVSSVTATAIESDSDEESGGEDDGKKKKKEKKVASSSTGTAVTSGTAAAAPSQSLDAILGDMDQKKSTKSAEEEERARQKEIAEFAERQAARETAARDIEKKAREAEIARERAEKEDRHREKTAARERKKEQAKEREKKKHDRQEQAKAARSRVLNDNGANNNSSIDDVLSPKASSSPTAATSSSSSGLNVTLPNSTNNSNNGASSPASTASPRSPSPPPQPRVTLKPGSNAVVWQGHVKKVLANPFSLFARHHGGAPIMGMGKCLPSLVEVAGKIKSVKVADFVDRLIKTSRKKVLVLRFESSSSPDDFRAFCNFFVEDGTRCAVLDYQENHGTLLYVVPPLNDQQIAASGLTEQFMVDSLQCHRPSPDSLWAIACMTKDSYDIGNRHDALPASAPSSPPHEHAMHDPSAYTPAPLPYGHDSNPYGHGYNQPPPPQHLPPYGHMPPHDQGYPQHQPGGYGMPPHAHMAPPQQWGAPLPPPPYLPPLHHQLPPLPGHATPYDPRLQQHVPIPPPTPLPPPSDPRLRGAVPIPPPQPLPLPLSSPPVAVEPSGVLPELSAPSVSETLSYLESLFVATGGAPPPAAAAQPPSDPRRRA